MFAADPPAAYTAACYAIGFAVSYLMYAHLKKEKERAATGDHVVETTRDVAMPDHCVRCGRAHANVRLEFNAFNYTLSRYRAAFDRRLRTKYRFWFCPQCAKPVLRMRRIGIATLVLGIALMLMLPVLFVVSMQTGGMFYLNVATLAMTFGYAAIITGIIVRMRAGSGTVSVIDNGEETVLFRFHNQVYRNHFAQMNGEH